MVIPRLASLGVELSLAGAGLVCFAALLAGGPRAGSLARGATLGGAAAALGCALATLGGDDVWFFEALRVGVWTQSIKALIAAVLLVTAIRERRGDGGREHRTAEPFFRLVGALALVLAAGAGDLIVLWITLDIASAATVMAVAMGGSWRAREGAVRRLLSEWLPASLVLLLGTIILLAAGGSSRYSDLEIILPRIAPEPAVAAGIALVLAGVLVRAVRFAVVLARMP